MKALRLKMAISIIAAMATFSVVLPVADRFIGFNIAAWLPMFAAVLLAGAAAASLFIVMNEYERREKEAAYARRSAYLARRDAKMQEIEDNTRALRYEIMREEFLESRENEGKEEDDNDRIPTGLD